MAKLLEISDSDRRELIDFFGTSTLAFLSELYAQKKAFKDLENYLLLDFCKSNRKKGFTEERSKGFMECITTIKRLLLASEAVRISTLKSKDKT